MRRLALLTILLLSPLIFGFTLTWQAVTTYTDGSAIVKPVKYTVWDTGAQIGSNLSATSFLLPNPGSGVTHFYEVAAVVDNVTGGRAGVNFTSAYLTPATPGGVAVVP